MQAPVKTKMVTKMDLPGLPKPVKMSSYMMKGKNNPKKTVLPSCEYRKEEGGYYNTCLT